MRGTGWRRPRGGSPELTGALRTGGIVLLACIAAAGGWWLQDRGASPPPAQASARPGVPVYAEGQDVRDYALPDLSGRSTRLARWQGKVLLLNFWASWCGPCRAEMPMLARMQRAHADDGLQIVGIAMEQPEATKAFLRALDVDYPILVGIDADPIPTTSFGDTAGALPYSVLVSPSGRIITSHLGVLDPGTVTAWLARAKARE